MSKITQRLNLAMQKYSGQQWCRDTGHRSCGPRTQVLQSQDTGPAVQGWLGGAVLSCERRTGSRVGREGSRMGRGWVAGCRGGVASGSRWVAHGSRAVAAATVTKVTAGWGGGRDQSDSAPGSGSGKYRSWCIVRSESGIGFGIIIQYRTGNEGIRMDSSRKVLFTPRVL